MVQIVLYEIQRLSSNPFAVQCQTCGSRLKVSDPSLIGTIASCPKCNSMVQIVPEPNPAAPQVAVGTENVDSQAITEDAIDVETDSHVDPASMPSGFASSESLESEARHDSLPASVPPDWQSERTQRSRQIGLIVALSLSSLVGAILLFSWFVRSWQQETANSTASRDLIAVTEDSNPVTPDTPEQSPAVSASERATVESHEPASREPESTDGQADIAGDDRVNPASDETKPNASPAQVAATKSDSIPSDLLPRSPLAPVVPEADTAETSEDASKMERLPEPLQKFIPTFNLGGEQQEATLDAPPTLDDVQVQGAAEEDLDPMLVATPPEPINMRRALAIEFALSPANGSYPLSDLMLTVSQITGVPIQIDWVGFDLVGIGIRDEVPVKKGWNSAKVLLDSVAESIGAVIEQDEYLLTLGPSDQTKQDRLGDLLELSDFDDGQASATAVLNQFLPWGNVSTALQQASDQQKLAALAVEAMRRIRGVAPKVPELRFRRWAQPASDAILDWPLLVGGNAGPQYDAPLTMAGFLRRTARGNQATCFVNWFDANRRRLSPAQLTMPFTGEPAGEVIADELRPFALQVRQVDANHWWVGTEATYDRFPVIVWTQPLGADQAVLTQRLANAVASTEGSQFSMAVDPQTGRALLLLPRYLVRQLPTIQNGLNLTKAP